MSRLWFAVDVSVVERRWPPRARGPAHFIHARRLTMRVRLAGIWRSAARLKGRPLLSRQRVVALNSARIGRPLSYRAPVPVGGEHRHVLNGYSSALIYDDRSAGCDGALVGADSKARGGGAAQPVGPITEASGVSRRAGEKRSS